MSKPIQELESLLLSSRVGKSANEYIYYVKEDLTKEAYDAIVNKTHKLKKGNTYILQSSQGELMVYVSGEDSVAKEGLFLNSQTDTEEVETGLEYDEETGLVGYKEEVEITVDNPEKTVPNKKYVDSRTNSTLLGLQGVQTEIELIQTEVEALQSEIELLQGVDTTLSSEVASISTKVSTLESQITDIVLDLNGITNDVNSLITNYTSLNTRVEALENGA